MSERQRWNDQAVDGLEVRVENAENQVEALAELPQRVVEIRGDLSRLKLELREDMREGFKKMATRFDTVDQAHERSETRAGKVDWKTIIAFASTVVVPIVVAIILEGGSP